MNAMCKSRCTACMYEAVYSIKKIVAGLSYPMPLCFLVKAALCYIAAGSCSSCGVPIHKAINAPTPFKGAH